MLFSLPFLLLPIRFFPQALALPTTNISPLLQPRDTTKTLNTTLNGQTGPCTRVFYYCSGHINDLADGGCGGVCTPYPYNDNCPFGTSIQSATAFIWAPGTNCLDTDGSLDFKVCAEGTAGDWTDRRKFRPGVGVNGRWRYNTIRTGVVEAGACR